MLWLWSLPFASPVKISEITYFEKLGGNTCKVAVLILYHPRSSSVARSGQTTCPWLHLKLSSTD